MKKIINYLEQKENSKINIIEQKVEKEPFDFIKFGNKSFDKVNLFYELNGNEKKLDFIVKNYNGIDITMELYNDKNYREIEFANSNLIEELKDFFEIPIIFANIESKQVFMKNKETELNSFGPPNMPTEEELKLIIKAIVLKDAKLNSKKYDFTAEYISPFINLKNILINSINNKLNKEFEEKLKNSWKWFFDGIKFLKKEINVKLLEKLENIYNEKNMKNEIKNIPFAYQHADFYFGNVGLSKNTKPVVIDWETISFAPIGLDYLLLTSGMPPILSKEALNNYYVEIYNENSDKKITLNEFQNWLKIIEKHLFITQNLTMAIRYGFAENPYLPEKFILITKHKEHIKNNFIKQLNEL